jgi:hypothetical protein
MPQRDGDDVMALSASAYVVLPPGELAEDPSQQSGERRDSPEAPAPAMVSIPNAGNNSLISPLRISSPSSFSDCQDGSVALKAAAYMTAVRPCSLLQAEAREDAVVFFLQHQAGHGLVRLSGPECRARTAVRIARKGNPIRFPIAKTNTVRENWSETYDWLLAPDLDTYYAVVVSDAQLARRIANHMDELPVRCSVAIRPGFDGDELRDWLAEFAMITARSANSVDWRALRVNDVL